MLLSLGQRMLNEQIRARTAAREQLRELEGKRFAVSVRGSDFRVVAEAAGEELRLSRSADEPCDVELAAEVSGRAKTVVRAFPGAHEERRGQPGRFRQLVGSDYLLWVGAWSRAKGARNVSERFARLRDVYSATRLKLIMFGAYGGDELPVPHQDIVVFDRRTRGVKRADPGRHGIAAPLGPYPVAMSGDGSAVVFQTTADFARRITRADCYVLDVPGGTVTPLLDPQLGLGSM